MVSFLLFLVWMGLWALLCYVFYILDKDLHYSRYTLPNLPLEKASAEDIIEMAEKKLEEKPGAQYPTSTVKQRYTLKLSQFTAEQLLDELHYRVKQP